LQATPQAAFGNSIGDRQMLEYDRLWRTGVIRAGERVAAPHPSLKFKLGEHRFLRWGEDHFGKISKPCSRNFLIAAWDAK